MKQSIEQNELRLELDENEQTLVLSWDGKQIAEFLVQGAVVPYAPGMTLPTISTTRCTIQREWLCCEWHLELVLPQPTTITVRDLFRFSADGTLEWHRSWWHEEAETLPPLELQAGVKVCGPLQSHLLPGLLYDGNTGADPERLVPRLALGTPNLFEEHKYPTPLVQVECEIQGECYGLTLETVPGAVVDGHLPDQWWSLGLTVDAQSTWPTLLSNAGRLSMNGQQETVYCGQNHIEPYQGAWVSLHPRHVYEKHYCLQVQRVEEPRQSWRQALHRAIRRQPALTADEAGFTHREALEEAIALKVQYALGRWVDHEHACGMDWWPHRPEFANPQQTYPWAVHRPGTVEYGWVGQNMRLGFSLWRWGQRQGDVQLQQRGLRIAESWQQIALQTCAQNRPAPTLYLVGGQGWCDTNGGNRGYARPTGETLAEFALFCRELRAAGEPREEWEEALTVLLNWYTSPGKRHPNGLFPLVWNSDGSVEEGPIVAAGALFIVALAQASLLPDGERWLPLAQELMETYAAFFLGEIAHHPCGATLDAHCEDMESGLFLLMGATRLAEAEQVHHQIRPERLIQAQQAADWTLTWTYTWNVPLQAGTLLHAANLSTRGWSDVSVQNRCLHVYSPAAELLRLAQLLETHELESASLYREQAWRMLVPLVRTISRPEAHWGMDEAGEQTEQYNQTNYIQHPWDPVARSRGGIARWFVPWITVWVLSVCLDFLDKLSEDHKN